MALTAAQICTLANQIAKCRGFASQAGQILNAILQELAQTYNFDIAKGEFTFTFNTALATTSVYPNITAGGGPYALPADFLRMVDGKDAMWFLNGVPYPMIPCDLSEFDQFVQQAGLQSYPYIFATDMSQTPPVFVVYPPPSGNYSGMIRYFRQMPEITTPESSSSVPWFPNTTYLIRRLAGELCFLSGDSRSADLLSDSNEQGAGYILRKYLTLADDKQDRSTTVKLDRRRFGSPLANLPNTKTVGF